MTGVQILALLVVVPMGLIQTPLSVVSSHFIVTLQESHGYFNQQIWLSQLHVCSLNACMALNRYEECAKCIANPLRNVWD